MMNAMLYQQQHPNHQALEQVSMHNLCTSTDTWQKNASIAYFIHLDDVELYITYLPIQRVIHIIEIRYNDDDPYDQPVLHTTITRTGIHERTHNPYRTHMQQLLGMDIYETWYQFVHNHTPNMSEATISVYRQLHVFLQALEKYEWFPFDAADCMQYIQLYDIYGEDRYIVDGSFNHATHLFYINTYATDIESVFLHEYGHYLQANAHIYMHQARYAYMQQLWHTTPYHKMIESIITYHEIEEKYHAYLRNTTEWVSDMFMVAVCVREQLPYNHMNPYIHTDKTIMTQINDVYACIQYPHKKERYLCQETYSNN